MGCSQIMGPFCLQTILRHLITNLGVPEWDPNFGNYPNSYCYRVGVSSQGILSARLPVASSQKRLTKVLAHMQLATESGI